MTTSWSTIPDLLTSWHTRGDRNAASEAVGFLEVELRLAFPAAARRRWPTEQQDDALRAFLTRELGRPLPVHPDDPRRYFQRSFRNWCISIERRNREIPTDDLTFSSIAADEDDVDAQRQRDRAIHAITTLRIEDRVALKMVDAPSWMTHDETVWLAARAGSDAAELRALLMRSNDILALSLIFDPGPPPVDAESRRTRLERFRKRRNRARDALRAAVEGT